MNLNNKVAVVTGAASGIGRAIANTFALAGAEGSVPDCQSWLGHAMSRPTWFLRLFAAALLAFGYALSAVAPANAEDIQETPWYLPQAWVHPAPIGPYQSVLYGYSFRRAYGSFSKSCYGSCRMVRGTVATGNGVVLFRPKQAVYDQRSAEITLNRYLAKFQQVAARSAMPHYSTAQILGPAPKPMARSKPLPRFTVQNGVRIVRRAPPRRT